MSELTSFILSQEQTFRRARLPSLYSDFHAQRNSNPDGFAANCTAWIDALTKAAWAGVLPSPGTSNDTLSIATGEDLLRALETKEFGRPLALGTVIDEAVSQGRLIPLDELMGAVKSIYSRKWKIQPWWLVSWGLRQIGLAATDTHANLPVGRFVIISSLENAANMIVARMGRKPNRMDRTYPMSLFKREAAKALDVEGDLTDTDLSVVLKYLARDKGLVAYDSQIVIFKGVEDTMPILSSQDVTVATIKDLIVKLRGQMDSLSERVNAMSEKVRMAIANNNRATAVAALKSKKIAEETLRQRLETFSQLEEMYDRIEQATDQVAMVRVMSASTNVLRNIYKDVGGIENVDEIVEHFRDETQKIDEIGDGIQALGQGSNAVDDDVLDEELEGMLYEAETQKNERTNPDEKRRLVELMQLPDVPSNEPVEKESSFVNRTPPGATDDVTDALNRVSLDGPAKPGKFAGDSSQEYRHKLPIPLQSTGRVP